MNLNILLIIGVVVGAALNAFSYLHVLEFLGFLLAILCFVGLIIAPVAYINSVDFVQRFEATRMTVEHARASGDGLEAVAFRASIADWNASLAATQYWNTTLFDAWITDEVDQLEPIE